MCPEEHDAAFETGPASFRWPEGGVWSSRAGMGASWWRRVVFTRWNGRKLVAARGWESGHATCRGESCSSRRTQPLVRQEKWRPGQRRTVAGDDRR